MRECGGRIAGLDWEQREESLASRGSACVLRVWCAQRERARMCVAHNSFETRSSARSPLLLTRTRTRTRTYTCVGPAVGWEADAASNERRAVPLLRHRGARTSVNSPPMRAAEQARRTPAPEKEEAATVNSNLGRANRRHGAISRTHARLLGCNLACSAPLAPNPPLPHIQTVPPDHEPRSPPPPLTWSIRLSRAGVNSCSIAASERSSLTSRSDTASGTCTHAPGWPSRAEED